MPEVNEATTRESSNSLTDWDNEPTVSDLNKDFIDAKSYKDAQITKIEGWLDNLHIRNKAKIKTKEGYSSISPKLIRKQAEWRYAALSEPFLSTDDIYNISPVSFYDKEAAVQNQLVLNNQFNTKLDKVAFIDEFVRTAVDEGTIIIRTGWDFIEKEVTQEEPIFEYRIDNSPQAVELHQNLQQMMEKEPAKFQHQPPEIIQAHQLTIQQGIPIMPVNVGSELVTKQVTVKNQPSIEICNYQNITIDPTAQGDIRKAGFIIYSFETSLSELEEDGKYANLDKIDIKTNSILSEPDHIRDEIADFNFSDTPRAKIVAYEYWGYWDIDSTGIVKPIIATYVGDTMIRMEDNPYPDGELPFVIVKYLPVRNSMYGEPDGALLEDNQSIIGAVTRGMIDVMGRSANGQMGVSKSALDMTNKRKFDRGQDYEFNPQVDPRTAFHMHTYPEIPQSATLMLQYQNAEAESITGVKAFSGGISGDTLGNTATSVRGALDAASKREIGILRRLSEGVKEIGRKIISMNAIFLSEKEVIRITDDDFVDINRDDLAGNFDLKLNISTAEADNQKAQELSFMLQTMGNSMDSELSRIILSDIAKLRSMPSLAKRITEFSPEPDPIAQETAVLEIELLKAKIANEQAFARERQTQAELNLAKSQKELASAVNMGADTDTKNLDYVEQEAGIKHERDVDRISSQAESQTKSKLITEAFSR